jgi:hypothetical protein
VNLFQYVAVSSTRKLSGAKMMFGWLKPDPVKKLRKAYDQKLEQAMHAQRNGDMRLFADLTAESEELWKKIEQLQQQQAANQ